MCLQGIDPTYEMAEALILLDRVIDDLKDARKAFLSVDAEVELPVLVTELKNLVATREQLMKEFMAPDPNLTPKKYLEKCHSEPAETRVDYTLASEVKGYKAE